MRKKIQRGLKKFLESPKTSLAIGIMLLAAGIFEATETMIEKVVEELLGFDIGAHHGVMIFGLSHILLAVVHILEGLEHVGVAEMEKDVKVVESGIEAKE